jgi:DNA-binding ferritin-like protein
MKNIDKLINFSIRGVVDESSNLLRDLRCLADQMFKVAHLERYRHLNYQGEDFEFIHKTLEDRYTLLEKSYDMVAEYIRKLGFKVDVYSESLSTDEKSLDSEIACMSASVEEMEGVLNMIYTVLNDIDELEDSRVKIQLSGLESDFTALISQLDQSNWIFNSRIGESNAPTTTEHVEVIEEPKSLVHVVNEDIQYPNKITDVPQPEEVPQETGISVINPNESVEMSDPLGASEPEPDHASLFARLYRKLRGYGSRRY